MHPLAGFGLFASLPLLGLGSLGGMARTDADDVALREQGAALEVVFTEEVPGTCTAGCRRTFSDDIAVGTNPTYRCPDGAVWTLTMGTPYGGNGFCYPMPIYCYPLGTCTYTRSAVLSLSPTTSNCRLWYRDLVIPGPYIRAANGQHFSQWLASDCAAGSTTEKTCDGYRIEFYDTDLDTNEVVFSWKAEVCCSKCPG